LSNPPLITFALVSSGGKSEKGNVGVIVFPDPPPIN
jgi:hypothetical protein